MVKGHCRDYLTLKYIYLRSYFSSSLQAQWGKKRHLLKRKIDYVEFSPLSRYSQLLRTPEVDVACMQEGGIHWQLLIRWQQSFCPFASLSWR